MNRVAILCAAIVLATTPLSALAKKADKEFDSCVNYASEKFSVAPVIIRAIMQVEGGKPGLAMKNRDGSYDYGVMQINSWWFDHGPLPKYGLTVEKVRDDACTNIYVGTWILANELADAPDFWEGVGNYNSRKTRCKECHFVYRDKVTSALRGLGAIK